MVDSFVVIDLETTGLHPEQERIIEIGAIKVEQGHVVEELSLLLYPDKEISALITEITGITNEMLQGKPRFQEVYEELLAFLGDYPLMGHNVRFDYRFLKTELNKVGQSFDRAIIDTLDIAKCVHDELPSRSLEKMCSHYGIVNKGAHRAIHDATATMELYYSMKDKFEKSYPNVFVPVQYFYKVRKDQPMTVKQKNYLNDLLKYHKINRAQNMDELTKSEASRLIDKIILEYGKLQSHKSIRDVND